MAILFVEPESQDYPAIQDGMLDGEWQCLYGLAAKRRCWPPCAKLGNASRTPPRFMLLDRLIPPPNPESRQQPLDGGFSA
jgi:hypothetical protein